MRRMDLNLCRICCSSQGKTFIFSEDSIPQISTKIMLCCANVTITEGDGLPSRICKTCEVELKTAYRFILKCQDSDKQLRSQIVDTAASLVVSELDCKPKSEIKVEENHFSDHYEDAHDDYVHLDLKEDIEIKPENLVASMSVKKSLKKTNYKGKASRKCTICGRIAASRSALAVHMRNHTGETPFACPNCVKKFKDQGGLTRHIVRNHFEGERVRNFICENCGKGFFSKNDVKIHMRTHTGETPYMCTDCPAKFTQISALLRHKTRHSGERNHTCSTCSKGFYTREEVKVHQRVHSDEKKFQCSLCNVSFKCRSSLKKHISMHLKPNSFVCNYCGQAFNQKGSLKGHIDRKHSEKSGICTVCRKNVSNIEMHMWRHTGQRPLKCELCSSSFFELKALARHTNYRHKNPDKFKCTYEACSMTFPSRPMLLFHTAKLHETGIPFPCDRCSRGFYRKNDLARHKIGTHKERLLA